jgi:lipopolysaccharide export system permease protein
LIRRLDRYISKELIVPLLTGTLVIAGLFAANELIAIFKELKVTLLPWPSIAQLVLLRMPRWLILTLPVGMAIGSALAVGRLAREAEITALRAAGIPFRRVLTPIFWWGLAMGGLNLYIAESLQPASAPQYRRLAAEAAILSAEPVFRANTTLTLGRFNVIIGSLDRRDDGSLQLRDVFLYEIKGPEEVLIYQASSGVYRAGVWTFPNAQIRWIRGGSLVNFQASKEVVVNEPINISDLFIPLESEAMTARELSESIVQRERRGESSLNLIIAYHSRFAIPASCVVFALTSAIVAMRLSRSGPFVGLMASLVLVGLYYNIHVIATKILGEQGYLPPIWSAWAPNLLYLVVALIAYRRLE